jgi:hypothetical protein
MTPEMIEKLWQRSQGKCECIKAAHNHPDKRCNKILAREMLDKEGEGNWEIYQIFVSGGENINAYAVYCTECFKKLPHALKKEERFSSNLWNSTQ